MTRGKLYAQDDLDLAGHHIVDWRWLDDIPTAGASDAQVIAYINGKVQWASVTSEGIASIEWDDIASKPTEFTPENHTHVWNEVTNKPAFVNSVTAGVGINVSATTGSNVVITCDLTWSELSNKPTEFAPEDHTHSITELTDYNAITALTAGTFINVNGTTISVDSTSVATSGHTHTIGDISDFPTTWAWTDLTGVPSLVNSVTASTGISVSGTTGNVTITNSMTWGTLPDKPSTFNPSTHTHTVADITDFPTNVVNNVSGGTNINVSTSTGDVVISAPNAITALAAGTNIAVNGTTVSVVDAPTFAGKVDCNTLGINGGTVTYGSSEFEFSNRIRIDSGGTNLGFVIESSDVECYMQFVDSGGYANITENSSNLYLRPGGVSALGVFPNKDTQCYSNLTVDGAATIGSISDDFPLVIQSADPSVGIRFIDSVTTGEMYFNGTLDRFYIRDGANNFIARVDNGLAAFSGDIYANYNGPEGDSYVYFYEGGTYNGAWLKWDDSESRFRFSDPLEVTGDLEVGGDVTATGAVYGVTLSEFNRIRQTSDKSSSSVTPSDSNLRFSAEANSTYMLDGILLVRGGDALSPDGSITITVPSGATVQWHEGVGAGGVTPKTTGKATLSISGTATTMYRVSGVVITGGTAGFVTVTWAQATASGNSVILDGDSVMMMHKIA